MSADWNKLVLWALCVTFLGVAYERIDAKSGGHSAFGVLLPATRMARAW
jgi:hypothetical protein